MYRINILSGALELMNGFIVLLLFTGEPEQWYEHNAKNPPDPQPNPRVPSNEAKHTREKVEGK